MNFYTKNLAPGLIAHMKEVVDTPWGPHEIRCNIIHSQRDNCPAVVWPVIQGKFYSTPPMENVKEAERIILEQLRKFLRGESVR